MISSANRANTADTTYIEIMHLHPYEMRLIKAIRNHWRFGEMTILVRNGLPYRMVRTQEFIDLPQPLEVDSASVLQ